MVRGFCFDIYITYCVFVCADQWACGNNAFLLNQIRFAWAVLRLTGINKL